MWVVNEEIQVREAPLEFEPRISCLQDRHFDQLSYSAAAFELPAQFDRSSFSS